MATCQIADGMTIQVGQVNLMLETRGGAGGQGGATWYFFFSLKKS